jgi:hypothetical protein
MAPDSTELDETGTDHPDDRNESDDRDRMVNRFLTFLNYAVLAGLLLLAFISVVQFYLSAQSAINTWITPEFRAPFRALFNLVVLLLAGLGISYQIRRLTRGSSAPESE